MKTEDWLPNNNDTRAVLAAAYTQFFENAEVQVIPSDFPVDVDADDLPEAVNAFGTLEISDVTADQARAIHKAIHSARRAASWRSGGLSYGWPNLKSLRIYLVRRKDESAYRTMFPVVYSDTSDIDLILAYAKNPFHQAAFEALNLKESQMAIRTYLYDGKLGWSLKE